jgi:hypothetical protein
MIGFASDRKRKAWLEKLGALGARGQ